MCGTAVERTRCFGLRIVELTRRSQKELELSPPEETDEALVRCARAGDRAAFDRLVERYASRVFRMIRAQVGDPSLAEDLAQETLLNAFVALPRFGFRSSFYTWLYRIMTNTVGQHQRKNARRRDLDAMVDNRKVEPVQAPDALLESREAREQVWRALAALPEEYREPVVLREWEGKTYAEIAEVLGCPLGTVASRIARARGLLAERLRPHE